MYNAMRAYSKMEVQFHAYLAAVLDNEEWQSSCSAEFNLGESVAGPY
jgi:hypothetical protein